MALSIKALERLRALRRDANSIRSAEERFKKATEPSHVDKHNFLFNTGDRCSAFRVHVNLESYTGTYGNPSVGTFLNLYGDKGDIQNAFIKALNIHRTQILQTMADVMDKTADDLKDEAEKEIEALRELIAQPISNSEAA